MTFHWIGRQNGMRAGIALGVILACLRAAAAPEMPRPAFPQRNWVIVINPGADCTPEELPMVKSALHAFAPDALVVEHGPAGRDLSAWAEDLRKEGILPPVIPVLLSNESGDEALKQLRMPDPAGYQLPPGMALPPDQSQRLRLSDASKGDLVLVEASRKSGGLVQPPKDTLLLGEHQDVARLERQLAREITGRPERSGMVFVFSGIYWPELDQTIGFWRWSILYGSAPRQALMPMLFDTGGLPTHAPSSKDGQRGAPLLHVLSETGGRVLWETFPVDGGPPLWSSTVDRGKLVDMPLPTIALSYHVPAWMEELLGQCRQNAGWLDRQGRLEGFSWYTRQDDGFRAFPSLIRKKLFKGKSTEAPEPFQGEMQMPLDAVLSPASSLCVLPMYSDDNGLVGEGDADYAMDIVDLWNKKEMCLYSTGPSGCWPTAGTWMTDRYLCLFGTGENNEMTADRPAPYWNRRVRRVIVFDFLTGCKFSAKGPPAGDGWQQTGVAKAAFDGARAIDPNDGRQEAWREIIQMCRRSIADSADAKAPLSVAVAWAKVAATPGVPEALKTEAPARMWKSLGDYPRVEEWCLFEAPRMGEPPDGEKWQCPKGYKIPSLKSFLGDEALFLHHPETFNGDASSSCPDELWLKMGTAAACLMKINFGSCPYPMMALRPEPNLLLIAGQRLPSARRADGLLQWMLLIDLKDRRAWWVEG